ncbi:ankyrin [Xylariaceae sp. FL0255]|nr:ankyrin [Xylariaceae sp. FL0255]
MPVLPRAILLQTPPPSSPVVSQEPWGSVVCTTSQHVCLSLDIEQLYHDVYRYMTLNPHSTLELIADVPSSQFLKVFRQNVNLMSTGAQSSARQNFLRFGEVATRDFIPSHNVFSTSSCLAFMTKPFSSGESQELLRVTCILLANNQPMEIGDPRDILCQIGMDANRAALLAFFSLRLSAVAATWPGLVDLSVRMKNGDAFRVLVEIGMEIANAEWIREYSLILIHALRNLGSRRTSAIAYRLLSHLKARDAIIHGPSLDYCLLGIADDLDVEMMSIFLDHGICFSTPLDPDSIADILEDSNHHSGARLQRWAALLITAGFDVDCQLQHDDFSLLIITGRWSGNFGKPDIDKWGGCFYFLDALWVLRRYDLYTILVAQSKRAKHCVTVQGLVTTSRKGIEELQLYINSKQTEVSEDLQALLEIALVIASIDGDAPAIQCLIEFGADPNTHMLLSELCPSWHPLVQAAAAGHLCAVRVLMHMGSRVLDTDGVMDPLSAAILGIVDEMHFTAQFSASYEEHIETVEYLIEEGLIPKHGLDAAVTALTGPRRYGRLNHLFRLDTDLCDLLFEAGVQVNGMIEGKDLLHFAIDCSCDLNTVEYIISRGAVIHSRPSLHDGMTMVHSAARSCSDDRRRIIELLFRHGATCNDEWGGPSILALSLDLFNWHHLTYDQNDTTGRFKKSLANRMTDNLDLFTFFLQNGAQFQTSERKIPEGIQWTPLLTLAIGHQVSDEKILELISEGADIHSVGDPEMPPFCLDQVYLPYTPLQMAVKSGRFNTARLLLSYGADINAPAFPLKGRTALQAACGNESGIKATLSLVEFLLDNGADVNAPGAKYHGMTALQFSISSGSMRMFCYLLDAGADVNIAAACGFSAWEDEKEYSPLDVAAITGRLDMVDILVKRGGRSADTGKSLYDFAVTAARRYRNLAIAKLLEEKAREMTREGFGLPD